MKRHIKGKTSRKKSSYIERKILREREELRGKGIERIYLEEKRHFERRTFRARDDEKREH